MLACAVVGGGTIRPNAGNGNCLYNSLFTAITDDPGVLSLFNDSYSIEPIYDAVVNLRLLATKLARHAESAAAGLVTLSPSEKSRADAYHAAYPVSFIDQATLDTLELRNHPYTPEHFLSSTLPMTSQYWGRDTVILWLAHELDRDPCKNPVIG